MVIATWGKRTHSLFDDPQRVKLLSPSECQPDATKVRLCILTAAQRPVSLGGADRFCSDAPEHVLDPLFVWPVPYGHSVIMIVLGRPRRS
jgi:hypothetical protein